MTIVEKPLLERVFKKDPVLIITGQSGCGKGTQTQLFKNSYKSLHPEKDLFTIGMGDEFRTEIPKFTPWARKKLEEILNSGKRHPFSIASMLWVKKILYEYNEGPILIEGSPRSYDEASAMLEFFNTLERKVFMIHINISTQEAMRRIIARNEVLKQKGLQIREDCSDEVKIKTKLNFYDTDVLPGIRKFSACSKSTLLSFESKKETDPKQMHMEILKSIANQHH